MMLKNAVSGYRLQWLLRCGNMALQIPCSRPYVECPFTMRLFLWHGRFYGGIIWWLMINILVKGYMSAGIHKSSDKLVSFCEQVLILYCCTKAMPTGTCRVFCLLVTYMLMSSIQYSHLWCFWLVIVRVMNHWLYRTSPSVYV